MTRLNLVPVEELSKQHLFAEFREIPRIPNEVRRLLKTKNAFDILKDIPEKFTLNTGHVKFLRNKLQFVKKRHNLLREECKKRGIVFKDFEIDLEGIPKVFLNDYEPTLEAIDISRQRISEKIALKPNFYKF